MTKGIPCPICGKPVHADFKPFCSKRCADVDLNRWLSERYVVSGADDESTDVPEEETPPRH